VDSTNSWKLRDVIVAAALAVPLGIFWSYAWGLAWQVASDAVPILGDFMDGFFVAGGVLVGYYHPVEGWIELAIGVQLLRIVLKLLGGAVLGGLAGKLIGDALAQTGVLNNFPIAQARTREI